MSQVKLTLRPPPNVDFVHGYPGIPPAGDRPQAAVKGAIEVRVGPQGVKAKWVRIELRKVETLPQGGPSNTFFDYVGPSPIVLWQSSEEYAMLHTQDFPFYIRIPESIPPSISLENRAGIRYELLATVCTKGKKGFLRRRKSTVTSTTAQIIIDKHELHSTWPVYCQPECRHIAQEGVNLIVDRNQTCYGPGDRVSVMATLKSDSLYTVILRGFELTLKETTIFRTGPYVNAKRAAPVAKTITVGENKFPVNATLYGGTERKVELYCDISPKHTTATLNAARHIDITYILTVKALMGTGTHVIMNLPVILSNWPRTVSTEAVRRIGPASSLSLIPPGTPATPAIAQPPQAPVFQVTPTPQPPAPQIDLPSTFSPSIRPQQQPSTVPNRSTSANAYGTSAASLGGSSTRVDELGYNRPGINSNATVDLSGYGNRPRNTSVSDSRNAQPADSPLKAATTNSRRPRSGGNGANRLTITNGPDEPDIPDTQRQRQPAPGGGSSRTPWPTAEEEKQRLFDKARADVERVQGSLARGQSVPAPQSTSQISQPSKPVIQGNLVHGKSANGASRSTPWPTAEEEKLRLYNEAQAIAKKTQNIAASPHDRSNSDLSGTGSTSKPVNLASSIPEDSVSGGSYRNVASRVAGGSSQIGNHINKSISLQASPPAKAKAPQYPTAEQEKAALKRYHEAKLAVERTQGLLSDEEAQSSSYNPVSYDALYPSSPSPSSLAKSYPPGGNDLPPPFDAASGQQHPHLSEKERYRRAYEAQDAAAAAAQRSMSLQNGAPTSQNYDRSSPPAFSGGSPSASGSQILSEKEMLRRKFEAQDAAAQRNGHPPASPPQPPPRATTRPAPPPAMSPIASGSNILSAIEEKAMLKAKYEAEERSSQPNGHGPTPKPPTTATPVSPPPLKPRPPVEYIQETQEEDMRVSQYVTQGITPSLDHTPPPMMSPFLPRSKFSIPSPGPPPPLPGNVTIE